MKLPYNYIFGGVQGETGCGGTLTAVRFLSALAAGYHTFWNEDTDERVYLTDDEQAQIDAVRQWLTCLYSGDCGVQRAFLLGGGPSQTEQAGPWWPVKYYFDASGETEYASVHTNANGDTVGCQIEKDGVYRIDARVRINPPAGTNRLLLAIDVDGSGVDDNEVATSNLVYTFVRCSRIVELAAGQVVTSRYASVYQTVTTYGVSSRMELWRLG